MLSPVNPRPDRQITGEVTTDVPASLQEAWKDAVKSRSKATKGALFNKWLACGGEWSKLLAQ